MGIIIKPVLLCIISIALIGIIRNFSYEFIPMIYVICAIMLVTYTLPHIRIIYDSFMTFKNKFSILSDTMKLTVKIIGISLLCEFASQLCEDNNAKFLAEKIDFTGKIVILSMVFPTVVSFMENVLGKLELL